MPDSKITALASTGTGTDPANDPLVIVDVSDTSMAATGTTKKVTLNQLLSCNPIATGNFTITGDLTVNTNVLKVDSTNDRVGIGTASPATILDIQSAGGVFARIQNTTSTSDAYLLVKNTTGEGFFGINALGPYIYTASALPIVFTTATSERYRIAGDGVATWSNVGGVAGTAMTLNSTGLGVGLTPSGGAAGSVFSAGAVLAAGGLTANQTNRGVLGYSSNETTIRSYGATAGTGFITFRVAGGGATTDTEAGRFDASGRLLLGRTSPLSAETFSSLGFALVGGATHQAIIGEASGNVFGGSFTNTPFRIRTNNIEVAQFDASGNFLSYLTSTAPTLSTNGAMVFNLTSNTNLRISVRGTDGTTRVANITLA
jgi:hypothetical protein